MNALVAIEQNNVAAYRASTDAAEMCKAIVVETAMEIQGRRYVKVEGWQAIAVAHGCTASAQSVERVEGGVRAMGIVKRMSDGAIIAEGEGFVGEDEPVWFGGMAKKWKWGQKRGEKIWYEEPLPKRADYAIRAMAQTRAISRACRAAFAHVVVMMNAGLSTTPAEEVPQGGFDDIPAAEFSEAETGAGLDQIAIINEGEWTKITSLLEATKSDVKRFCDHFNIRSVKELPAAAYRKALAQLERTFAELERRDDLAELDDDVFCAFAEALDTFTHEAGELLDWQQENPVKPFVGSYAEWLV